MLFSKVPQDGALLDSTSMVSACSRSPSALAACQAVDDDGEQRDDGVDDGFDSGSDGVNNRHDAVADCAEHGLDLGRSQYG
jgi:hypothetical protein